ncbi:MAG: hypothetical protein CSA81_00250 [Acidobacteria bacterium]|nr:MAG: hypothetical protein CSA81_00250 [Acidobacteriota bacterium]PIE91421.1 MAG: hypothetical protein CR997_01130 [Acidobacteriota bacterium]
MLYPLSYGGFNPDSASVYCLRFCFLCLTRFAKPLSVFGISSTMALEHRDKAKSSKHFKIIKEKTNETGRN